MRLTVARARYPLGHRWDTAGLSAGPRWGTAGLSACPRWGTNGLSACPRWGTAIADTQSRFTVLCHRPGASSASKTHFSDLGPPWRSHPCIEGYPQCHRVRAMGMERSDRQHQLIADIRRVDSPYMSPACCQRVASDCACNLRLSILECIEPEGGRVRGELARHVPAKRACVSGPIGGPVSRGGCNETTFAGLRNSPVTRAPQIFALAICGAFAR